GARSECVVSCWRDCRCFFFQAEDGIRDGHVTGVQTCALPIYRTFASRFLCATCVLVKLAAGERSDGLRHRERLRMKCSNVSTLADIARARKSGGGCRDARKGGLLAPERDAEDRSEEHTSELQSRGHLVCRLLLEKKNNHSFY